MTLLLAEASFPLRALPSAAERVLTALDAPPRLVAHLTLVHDVAAQLTTIAQELWPAFQFDCEAVLMGAATHDIGKTVHLQELLEPGSLHEEIGEALLLERGFPAHHARFARTHGGLAREPLPTAEDWLVMLADAVWKGVRRRVVEDGVLNAISQATGTDPWAVYLELDALLTDVADGAELRLAWQNRHPV